MKSRLLLFSALVIHSFTTAQVGKVELVADILPGPGSSSPEIAGAIDDKLVVGEATIPYYGTDTVYSLWAIDKEGQYKIIGQRDTVFSYNYGSRCFEYSNRIYFSGSDNNGNVFFCLSNTDSLPYSILDSFTYKGLS